MRRGNLTEGSIIGGIAVLALPMLAAGVLQNVQSFIDLWWVSILGKSSVASVVMAGQVLFLLSPLLMGASTGTLALVSRATGAGDYEAANRAAGQSMMLALTLGILSGVIGQFLSVSVLGLLHPPADVVENGVAYLHISLVGSFTVFILFIGNAALQGAGDAVTPMLVMGLANVLNIILDPIFIYGSPPVPAMGVRGAAVATVLAQACAAAVVLRLLSSGRTPLHVRFSQWRPDLQLAWRILRIGVPGAGQMLARSLMGVVMMSLVAVCGTAALAGYGIGMRYHMIMLMPAFALGGAAAALVGQSLGAGKPERGSRAAWLAAGIDVGIMVVAGAVLMIFAPYLIAAFNAPPDVVKVGAHYLRVVSPFYIFTAAGIVFGRSLNGAGDAVTPMIVTIVTLWGVQVPLAIHLSHIYEPATEGIWYAISAAMLLNGVLLTLWFQTGRWKHKQV